jgi:hypothetical protein
MIFIGVDPGVSGGIAVQKDDASPAAIPMPKRRTTSGVSHEHGFLALEKWLFALGIGKRDFAGGNYVCAIEKAGILRAQDREMLNGTIASAKGNGKVQGWLEALGVETIEEVGAGKWRKTVFGFGRPTKSMVEQKVTMKTVAIDWVLREWPGMTLLPTKRHRAPHDGMAEALCIMRYAKDTVK